MNTPTVLRFDDQDALEEYVETELNEKGIDPTVALIDSNGTQLTAHRTAPGGDGYAFEYDLGRLADTGQRHCCTCDEHRETECPELDWTWAPSFPVWVFQHNPGGATA